MSEIKIPDNHVAFCREVTRLAREHGYNNFNGSFDPGYKDPWQEKINFAWSQGRHGEDNNKIWINSTQNVHTKIDAPEEKVKP
jgi:hypothetical protein